MKVDTKKLLRAVAPVLVIVIALVSARSMIAGRELPERRQAPAPAPLVEVMPLARQDYRIVLSSRGVVEPRTQGSLVPQVAGVIVEVGAGFREGGFFNSDDLLVRIDPRDYQNAVTIAEAELTEARLRLAEEQARAEQARRDWERLESTEQPSALALRQPQLAGARAAVAAAEARLARARLDLERTAIRAPYAGRVLEKNADIGQYVTPGGVLAKIFAVDFVEVRLPLSNRQIAHIDIPEAYRDNGDPVANGPLARLAATIGFTRHQWTGTVVRSEGTIDSASRQVFVIAQVKDPYRRRADGQPPLKVGQFVEAEIEGHLLRDVFVVPRKAIRGSDTVYVVDPGGLLRRRDLDVAWRDDRVVVARGSIADGDRVVTSALALATDGMPVRVAGGEQAPAP